MDSTSLSACYLVLKSKDFNISRIEQNESEIWVAENDSALLRADSPTELLGLVSMYEHRGKDWIASDSDIDTFLKKFGYET